MKKKIKNEAARKEISIYEASIANDHNLSAVKEKQLK